MNASLVPLSRHRRDGSIVGRNYRERGDNRHLGAVNACYGGTKRDAAFRALPLFRAADEAPPVWQRHRGAYLLSCGDAVRRALRRSKKSCLQTGRAKANNIASSALFLSSAAGVAQRA